MTTRRNILTAGAAGAALAGASIVPALAAKEKKSQARLNLDLTKPSDLVLAYVKLRASSKTEDVYYWFTGSLDMCVPGQGIKPIIRVESIILRRTKQIAEREFTVTDWEAAVYRDVETGAFIEGEIKNPITGRMVKPLMYREGPVTFLFSENEPRIIGLRDPLPKNGKPFSYPYKIVGDDIWMTKESYIQGPAWLKMNEFPLETPGEKMNVATTSILKAKWSDINNPAISSVPTEFAYTATSDWLPWMLMGQTPGFVVWHEAGRKYFSVNELPQDTVAKVREVHPLWFNRPDPWPEFTNMYFQYKEQRKPAEKL